MQNEPVWLEADSLSLVNAAVVAHTGEPYLVLDRNLLESAATRPINLWLYEDVQDLVRLGVKLLFGIAQNHPFQQGNKRTAWSAFIISMELNGLRVEVEDSEATAQAIIDVITGARDEAWFVEFVRPDVHPV